MVGDTVLTSGSCAARATVEHSAYFDAVPDDPAAAVRALRSTLEDRALEAVEGVVNAVGRTKRERAVVIVPADVASVHRRAPFMGSLLSLTRTHGGLRFRRDNRAAWCWRVLVERHRILWYQLSLAVQLGDKQPCGVLPARVPVSAN
ncbi:MAG: hypothetical protein ICV70_04935 [Jiangellaceae bacterium]|nr:hypothetical protein [Jiangellaceae bacterium]